MLSGVVLLIEVLAQTPEKPQIVFQSNRDGNWEIYLAAGDGSGAVNVTNHPASDARPALNRGATKIAFNSNRDGESAIYTMNLNGSGLKRLD